MARLRNPLKSARVQAALYYARKRRKERWLAGFPTEDPHVAGQQWNDNGNIRTSEG